MIESIDLLMPPSSQYGVLQYFTQQLYQALQRQGVKCRLIENQESTKQNLHKEIVRNSPDCTLSFNGLLPDENGRFLCDVLQIPHVACLVDSPNHFLTMVNSTHTILTCVDRFFCEFFRNFNFPNVLFFPHATAKDIQVDLKRKRSFDIVMPCSFLDHESLRLSWQEVYSDALCQVLDNAIEIVLSNQETPYMEAFTQALFDRMTTHGDIDPHALSFEDVFDQLENYIRGKDHLELIKAIHDVDIHIFGSCGTEKGWEKYLGEKQANVIIHDPVPYMEILEIMKNAKIVLNSCPSIKNGGHERIFTGFACGALVVASENPYLKEEFDEGSEIVFYRHQKWHEVNSQVQELLSNDAKRLSIVEKGREKVLHRHTWDNRAQQLLTQLPEILHRLHSEE